MRSSTASSASAPGASRNCAVPARRCANAAMRPASSALACGGRLIRPGRRGRVGSKQGHPAAAACARRPALWPAAGAPSGPGRGGHRVDAHPAQRVKAPGRSTWSTSSAVAARASSTDVGSSAQPLPPSAPSASPGRSGSDARGPPRAPWPPRSRAGPSQPPAPASPPAPDAPSRVGSRSRRGASGAAASAANRPLSSAWRSTLSASPWPLRGSTRRYP